MTTRYCDCDLGTGDDDGTSWANAYQTFQQALDNSVAGDVCYCKGTDTLSATLDVDTNAGSNAVGYIKFIGCNGSGNVDGTRFVIDANGGSFHAITPTDKGMIWFENIEVKGTAAGAYHGIYFNVSGASTWIFVNCTFHNNGGYGVQGYRAINSLYWRCSFYNNTAGGLYYASNWVFYSRFYDNGGDGLESNNATVVGSLVYDNGDDGADMLGALLYNCTIDANPDDGIFRASSSGGTFTAAIGCRITNHSGAGDIGLNVNSEPFIAAYNFFDNNTDHLSGEGGAWYQFIPIEGGSTDSNTQVNEAGGGGGDTNQGYTDLTEDAEDFNLRSDATLRRTAITIPKT